MPGFNQRGPEGHGPMTGRRMGRCTNSGANLKNNDRLLPGNEGENQTGRFQCKGHGFGWRREGRGQGNGRQNRFRGGQVQ